jgi:hypothetical protein
MSPQRLGPAYGLWDHPRLRLGRLPTSAIWPSTGHSSRRRNSSQRSLSTYCQERHALETKGTPLLRSIKHYRSVERYQPSRGLRTVIRVDFGWLHHSYQGRTPVSLEELGFGIYGPI